MPYRTLAEVPQEQSVDKIELIVQKVLAIPLEAWLVRLVTDSSPWYAVYKQLNIFNDGALYFIETPSISLTKDKRLKKFYKQIIKFNEEREKRQKVEADKKRFTEVVDSLVKEI